MYQRSYNKPVLINPSNYIYQTYRSHNQKSTSLTLDPRQAPTILNWLILINSPDLNEYIKSQIPVNQSEITQFKFIISDDSGSTTETWKELTLDSSDILESTFYKKEPLTSTFLFQETIDGLFCPFYLIIVPGIESKDEYWPYNELDSLYLLYIKNVTHSREVYLDLEHLLNVQDSEILKQVGVQIVHIKYPVSPDDFIDSLSNIVFQPPAAENNKNQLLTSADYTDSYQAISSDPPAITSQPMKFSPYSLSNELFSKFYSYN